MSTDPATLGGRLPLLDRESLAPAQKKLFDQMMDYVVPRADSAGFVARTDAGQLIGPFNPALLNPAIGSAFLELQFTEETHTSLSQRSRQVVILTVGAIWQAPYELYAHSAVGRRAGLSDDAVRTLAAGGLPQNLTEQEVVAHRVARSLSVEHRIDDALYREAETLFGAEGVIDIVVLVGIYHTVCAILNAFAIPAAAPT
jgi:4-carboxymuconolactone decarboxylase